MRLDAWLADAVLTFKQAGFDSARLEAELLACHVLMRNRAWLYGFGDYQLTVPELQTLTALQARRLTGEPSAYLTGQREFWSLTLVTAPCTLIPRPATETLVEWALELPLLATARVLDLGTGTGAIALALASEQPSWQVQGVDFQPAAVQLARSNAEKNHLERVEFLESDWFSAVHGQFDLIVSNPPYIDALDPHLNQGDVRFEPRSALVAPQQGLADLHFIIKHASTYLKNGAWLLLEHGYQQAPAVCQLLHNAGFMHIDTRHDLEGQPRISGGQWLSQAYV